MYQGLVGVFASLILTVAVLGAIVWNLHQNSHQMVVESTQLEALIDQQRESNRDTLYHNDTSATR